jgi:hypothetical protein
MWQTRPPMRFRTDMQHRPSRWVWGLALAPVTWLVVFAMFVVRTRLALGRWPAPYAPDPKDLGFALHHGVLLAGMPLMIVAVVAATVLAVIGGNSSRRWSIPLVALAGLATVVLLARLDPGYLFTWLGD